jgi:putative ABC transport system ATP-binding protein
MIRVVKVSKTYNKGKPNQVNAVCDVNIHLRQGEMVVIRGPSGSGKTSLLTLIGCIVRPTSGEIRVAGKTISRLPEKFMTTHRREHIGVIFQQLNLIQDLSVEQNLGLPLLPLDMPRSLIAGRTDQLLSKMGLESRRGFLVRQLSGGEQQRVAIARALINNPEALLADEPTAHLDTRLSKELMEMMKMIKNEGRTIVIASHDPLVYDHPSIDRVYEMKDGRIREE